MGLFDYVKVNGPEFVCSEGHDLSRESFQSKDFGCTMGLVTVSGNSIELEPGDYGDSPQRPLLGRFHVYSSCSQCPAFVQAKTSNLIDCSVDFELEIVDDVVRSIKRISPTTAEFLRDTPQQEWMRDCKGPMSHAEAHAMHMNGLRAFFASDASETPAEPDGGPQAEPDKEC